MNTKTIAAGLAVSAGIVALGMAAPATANASSWASKGGHFSTTDPNSESVYAQLRLTIGSHLQGVYDATFYSYGEHFVLTDNYQDGKGTHAYLDVEGSGIAKFTSTGDHDLNFSEGKKVKVMVCINGGPCSGWYSGGIT